MRLLSGGSDYLAKNNTYGSFEPQQAKNEQYLLAAHARFPDPSHCLLTV